MDKTKSYFLVALIIMGVVGFYGKYQQEQKDKALSALSRSASLYNCAPSLPPRLKVDSLRIFEGKIKRNQNLADILAPFNVAASVLHKLSFKSRPVFDVRKLVVGKDYSILYKGDSVREGIHFIYKPDPVEYIVYDLSDSGSVYKGAKPIEIIEKTLGGAIESSLYETMVASGAGPELVDMMVDVFAWQVDFFGIQHGDNFKLIYEEKFVDGKPVGIHRIVGAYFEHIGESYYAINYDQGKGTDYFDPKGVSLRRNLLKAPLNFTRISSRYSGRRFHPVQKRYKAHLGTDYAAPVGTPIRTVGDGVVLEARYGKYNGNFVKIKHNENISTQYLHMSRIKRGIRKGVRVKQGQTIGFVGQTGLARGPHLCYRFWKNGVQVDALKVDLPPSEPIKEAFKPQFDSIQQVVVRRLDQIEQRSYIPL